MYPYTNQNSSKRTRRIKFSQILRYNRSPNQTTRRPDQVIVNKKKKKKRKKKKREPAE